MDRKVPIDIQYFYSDPYNEFNILVNEKFWHGQASTKPLIIRNTSLYKEVDFANLTNLEKIVIVTTDSQIPKSAFNLKLTINNTIDPEYTMVLPFFKWYHWCVPSSFVNYITKIEISTDSIIDVEVMLYFITEGTTPEVE